MPFQQQPFNYRPPLGQAPQPADNPQRQGSLMDSWNASQTPQTSPWGNMIGNAIGQGGQWLGQQIGNASNAIPGMMGNAAQEIAQAPGIQAPQGQDTQSVPGYSPGQWRPPTVHDMGMMEGNAIRSGMMGAHAGFAGGLQGAMGQIGGILQGNAQRSAENRQQNMQYAAAMAPINAAMQMHRDRMGMKRGLLGMLGGGGQGAPNFPDEFNGAQVPQIGTPSVYDGSPDVRGAAQPDVSQFGGSGGLAQQFSDLAGAGQARTEGNLDLAGTQAQAGMGLAQRMAAARMAMQGNRLRGARYGDQLGDSMGNRRMLASAMMA